MTTARTKEKDAMTAIGFHFWHLQSRILSKIDQEIKPIIS